MSFGKTPKPPEEDPAVKILRDRQISDLAELDEEENRRIKAAMSRSRGVRAFRRSGASDAGSTTSAGGRPRGQRGSFRSGGTSGTRSLIP